MRITRIMPFALICLAGCGGPSIVGKWSATAAQGTATMEFTSNTFKQISDSGSGAMAIHVEASGTYTFDGKKLMMTIQDIQVPEALKAMFTAEALKKVKEKPVELDAKLDGDKLTLTPAQGSSSMSASASGGTFTRVK